MYVQHFFIIYVSTRKATKIFVLYIQSRTLQNFYPFLYVFIYTIIIIY